MWNAPHYRGAGAFSRASAAFSLSSRCSSRTAASCTTIMRVFARSCFLGTLWLYLFHGDLDFFDEQSGCGRGKLANRTSSRNRGHRRKVGTTDVLVPGTLLQEARSERTLAADPASTCSRSGTTTGANQVEGSCRSQQQQVERRVAAPCANVVSRSSSYSGPIFAARAIKIVQQNVDRHGARRSKRTTRHRKQLPTAQQGSTSHKTARSLPSSRGHSSLVFMGTTTSRRSPTPASGNKISTTTSASRTSTSTRSRDRSVEHHGEQSAAKTSGEDESALLQRDDVKLPPSRPTLAGGERRDHKEKTQSRAPATRPPGGLASVKNNIKADQEEEGTPWAGQLLSEGAVEEIIPLSSTRSTSIAGRSFSKFIKVEDEKRRTFLALLGVGTTSSAGRKRQLHLPTADNYRDEDGIEKSTRSSGRTSSSDIEFFPPPATGAPHHHVEDDNAIKIGNRSSRNEKVKQGTSTSTSSSPPDEVVDRSSFLHLAIKDKATTTARRKKVQLHADLTSRPEDEIKPRPTQSGGCLAGCFQEQEENEVPQRLASRTTPTEEVELHVEDADHDTSTAEDVEKDDKTSAAATSNRPDSNTGTAVHERLAAREELSEQDEHAGPPAPHDPRDRRDSRSRTPTSDRDEILSPDASSAHNSDAGGGGGGTAPGEDEEGRSADSDAVRFVPPPSQDGEKRRGDDEENEAVETFWTAPGKHIDWVLKHPQAVWIVGGVVLFLLVVCFAIGLAVYYWCCCCNYKTGGEEEDLEDNKEHGSRTIGTATTEGTTRTGAASTTVVQSPPPPPAPAAPDYYIGERGARLEGGATRATTATGYSSTREQHHGGIMIIASWCPCCSGIFGVDEQDPANCNNGKRTKTPTENGPGGPVSVDVFAWTAQGDPVVDGAGGAAPVSAAPITVSAAQAAELMQMNAVDARGELLMFATPSGQLLSPAEVHALAVEEGSASGLPGGQTSSLFLHILSGQDESGVVSFDNARGGGGPPITAQQSPGILVGEDQMIYSSHGRPVAEVVAQSPRGVPLGAKTPSVNAIRLLVQDPRADLPFLSPLSTFTNKMVNDLVDGTGGGAPAGANDSRNRRRASSVGYEYTVVPKIPSVQPATDSILREVAGKNVMGLDSDMAIVAEPENKQKQGKKKLDHAKKKLRQVTGLNKKPVKPKVFVPGPMDGGVAVVLASPSPRDRPSNLVPAGGGVQPGAEAGAQGTTTSSTPLPAGAAPLALTPKTAFEMNPQMNNNKLVAAGGRGGTGTVAAPALVPVIAVRMGGSSKKSRGTMNAVEPGDQPSPIFTSPSASRQGSKTAAPDHRGAPVEQPDLGVPITDPLSDLIQLGGKPRPPITRDAYFTWDKTNDTFAKPAYSFEDR
ncbi:unnamed protein product [Amoebophrya sp. A120]|nr:unnamed protein product [Amoebophrya sp. A120]|eukprot:GSA120T00012397001.1